MKLLILLIIIGFSSDGIIFILMLIILLKYYFSAESINSLLNLPGSFTNHQQPSVPIHVFLQRLPIFRLIEHLPRLTGPTLSQWHQKNSDKK